MDTAKAGINAAALLALADAAAAWSIPPKPYQRIGA
jgi:hypothetical protein